ncbi:PAAR domain-containing protein [Pseudoduganella sp. S-14]|uniref:PAAR domain-containing protein n=1 Tax=Pseudoduganella sp. S-14 TaxID=3404065 RepID=UPI003CE7EB48
MTQPIIVFGDKTTHGGTVIGSSMVSDTHGKGWARVGDMVSCPRCKGVFPITQGDQSLIDEGKAVAYHGCKTACGATLISGQVVTTTSPSAGAAPKADVAVTTSSVPRGFGLIGPTLLGAYQDEAITDSDNPKFRGRFQVVDATTGEPIRNQAVRLRSTSGQYVTGSTDADGYTQWVERDVQESLAFDLIQDSAT